MYRYARTARALLVALSIFMPRLAAAAWSTNGNPVCTAANTQSTPVMASDGSNGLFVVWQDSRNGSVDLYAQRFDSNGNLSPGWPADGIVVCSAAGDQKLAAIAADGAGGFYLAWEDYRVGGGQSDIYAQRMTGSGTLAPGWPAGGLALCIEDRPQGYPCALTAGGSLVVAWQDDRSGASSDIYAQRVTGGGLIQWASGGIPVCIANANQLFPSIASDGGTGVILVWQDARFGNPDVYAQRLNATGAALWTANGVVVSAADYEQIAPRVVANGSGGVVVAWDDYRDFNSDLYAQRLDASGAAQWDDDGVALVTDPSEQYGAGIVPDGAGGAIVPWNDYRGGSGDIYAQRITSAGAIASGWPTDGAIVCAATGDQFDIAATADGIGGMYVVWSDARGGGDAADIYAQRLTAGGATGPGWSVNGDKVCDAANTQLRPAVLPDGAGCLVAWADDRGATTDLYVGRSGGSTSVGVPLEAPDLMGFAPPFPNPARGAVSLHFRTTATGPARLTVLDLAGRQVRSLLDTPALGAGDHAHAWDGRDATGALTSTGLYLVMLETESGKALRKVTVLR